MSQEFVIKSQKLEDKINQLLPSQGGAQAGVDLSASSMIVPIIDLTESAEGSNVRQDLQTASSFVRTSSFDVVGTSTSIISTTGYWQIDYVASILGQTAGVGCAINISDGISTKSLYVQNVPAGTGVAYTAQGRIIAFVNAGETISVFSSNGNVRVGGVYRQIADINGNLTPLT